MKSNGNEVPKSLLLEQGFPFLPNWANNPIESPCQSYLGQRGMACITTVQYRSTPITTVQYVPRLFSAWEHRNDLSVQHELEIVLALSRLAISQHLFVDHEYHHPPLYFILFPPLSF